MSDRSALLKSIEKGKKLKQVKEVNDRSAPIVENRPQGNSVNGSSSIGGRGEKYMEKSNMNVNNASINNGIGGSGLFAGGFPKLRSTGKNLNLPNNDNNDCIKNNNNGGSTASFPRPPVLPTRPKISNDNLSNANSNANANLNKNEIPELKKNVINIPVVKNMNSNKQETYKTTPINSSNVKNNNVNSRGPPPVPPRVGMLSSSPKKLNTPINNSQGEKMNNENNNFLSQVKLKPVNATQIKQPLIKEPNNKVDSIKNNLTKESDTKQSIPKLANDINSIKKDIHNIPIEKKIRESNSPLRGHQSIQESENLHTIPLVPSNFTGRKKNYPSGSQFGLVINTFNNVGDVDSIISLEKQLEKAKIKEDFELCVELKKKIKKIKND